MKRKSLYRDATPAERAVLWPFPAATPKLAEEQPRVKPVKPPKGAKKKAKR
jgi:hypothetical protein